jgi:hypothetical protein
VARLKLPPAQLFCMQVLPAAELIFCSAFYPSGFAGFREVKK